MPYVSKELEKATKKANEEQKRKEAQERQKNTEEQRKQAEEVEKKRLAEEEEKKKLEQQKKEKKDKKKLEQKEKKESEERKKESEDREKELEERKVKRSEEIEKLSKVMGSKAIADETVFERLGFQVIRNEFASGQYSQIYKAKKDGNENMVTKLIASNLCPQKYWDNLQKEGFKILRFIGGDGSEPKATQFVKVWEIFSLQNKVYIFMDQVLKLSVLTRIKTKDTITESDAKLWAKQLAEAINVLQLSGIAHRNIRIENVIFDKEYKIKLVGFGISCIFWDNDKQEVIQQNKEKPSKKEMKNFDHLPPEVIQSDQYDPSSVDIWSLGVFICILLNRETPFDMRSGKTFEEQWNQYQAKYQLNPQSKQLLDRIFLTDISARIKIEEVLRNQWITNQKPKTV